MIKGVAFSIDPDFNRPLRNNFHLLAYQAFDGAKIASDRAHFIMTKDFEMQYNSSFGAAGL